jgi:hypothetical protein
MQDEIFLNQLDSNQLLKKEGADGHIATLRFATVSPQYKSWSSFPADFDLEPLLPYEHSVSLLQSNGLKPVFMFDVMLA